MGNDGFDPLGIATPEMIVPLRHAEVKHGRIAMLAAAGWPVQEWLHPKIAAALHSTNCLLPNGCSPSLFRGGLEQPELQPVFVFMLALGAVFETKDVLTRAQAGLKANEWAPNSVAGDVSFDPLGLASDLPVTDRFELQQAEMINGRLAMLTLASYAIVESCMGKPVTQLL